ncbi:MAG TPA: hypothetical protein EYQ81_11650 [Sneathiellales bacterium]|nr:hypothetical protein [Sneathiellales bacterium]
MAMQQRGYDRAELDPSKLIKQTRQYGKSSDPYTPMILASWNSASEVVAQSLNTGTDQLIMWPFSIEQLGARVSALVNARKPFIETESYLGPDRRGAKGRAIGTDSVEVPNALRARVLNRPDLAASPDSIEVARISLERIKINNIAQRISVIAKVLKKHQGDSGYMGARAAPELAAIDKSLGVIRRALVLTEMEYLQSFCNSVEQVTAQLSHAAPDLDSRGVALLEQTALALRVAMDLDEETANAAFRLSDEVAKAI